MSRRSSPPFTVEVAGDDDAIPIAHLNVWAYRQFAVELGKEAWPEMVRSLTAIDRTAEPPTFVVVRADGDVVGSGAYRPPGQSTGALPEGCSSISLLAVAPPERRQGIATCLIKACLERARDDDATALAAVVHDFMTEANGLFTAMGFHRERGLRKRDQAPYWIYSKEIL